MDRENRAFGKATQRKKEKATNKRLIGTTEEEIKIKRARDRK